MESFTINANEVENRLDPYFYKPEFVKIEKVLSNSPYKKIRDISAELKNGSTPSGGIFEEKGTPFFRSQDFDLFDFQISQFISPEFHKALSRSSIQAKDVLVAVVGATLGVIGYVPDSIKEANINQNVARIRVVDKTIDSKYLAIFLSSVIGQKMLLRNATITAQAYLNNQQLGEIKIPAVSSKKQKQIIKLVENAYEHKKQKEQEADNLLNSINDFVLRELDIKLTEAKDKTCFMVWSDEIEGQRIDPKKYSKIPQTIQKAIKKSKYPSKELSELIINNLSGEWGEEKQENGYILSKVLRNTNFDNKFNLNFDDVAERFIPEDKFKKIKLQNGDILVEKSGGSPTQPVGRVALIEDIEGNFVFSNFLQCFRINKKECLPEYLFAYLKTIYSLNYMEYLQNQTTGIKNLILEEFLNIPIALPPLDIQQKISKEVKKRMDEAKKLKFVANSAVEKAKQEVEAIILGK